MTRWMLDTNTVSHLLRRHPVAAQRLITVPTTAVCMSAITQGELLFGLARRPQARALHAVVTEFLRRVDVLPWDGAAATTYGQIRADLQRAGKALATMDLLIGTHALSVGAVLVTSDHAFGNLPGLELEDWTRLAG